MNNLKNQIMVKEGQLNLTHKVTFFSFKTCSFYKIGYNEYVDYTKGGYMKKHITLDFQLRGGGQ